MEKEPQWLIVEGCPRSGTTILTKLLNTNEKIAISLELNLLRLKLKKKKLVEKYRELFKGKKKIIYLGDKLPLYFFYHKELKEKLNDFKIIHISRNPLFVASSFKKLKENPHLDYNWNHFFSIKDACILWIFAWNKINEIKNDPNVFHLKYEDLIEDPKKTFEKISLFLNVENKFDLSLISKNASPMILNDKELKIVKRYLGKIIECWNFPLEKIENRFPRLKNFYFPREHIILKEGIWKFLKDIFVRFIKK
jgi:hypothetical protein